MNTDHVSREIASDTAFSQDPGVSQALDIQRGFLIGSHGSRQT